jgi:hypothetical protein
MGEYLKVFKDALKCISEGRVNTDNKSEGQSLLTAFSKAANTAAMHEEEEEEEDDDQMEM